MIQSYGSLPMMVRRELHVFYVLDTSGSMRGRPIATLNRAMEESMLALRQVAAQNGNAIIKVAVLEFSTTCRWMREEGPEEMSDFFWQDLRAGGFTNMGAALRELNSKLTKDEFLRSSTGIYLPVIIFMTDGYANDDYRAALDEALDNEMFREAIRIGFAVGDEANAQMIEQLTGDPKAVITTSDLELFADLLVFVTESASSLSIAPGGVGHSNMGRTVIEHAQQRVSGFSGADWGADDLTWSSAPSGNVHAWNVADW